MRCTLQKKKYRHIFQNDNDALEEDDTKENDEEMEVGYEDDDETPPPWPNVISARANPSCRKMGMTANR